MTLDNELAQERIESANELLAESNRDKIERLPLKNSDWRLHIQYQQFDFSKIATPSKGWVGGTADFAGKQKAYDWLDKNKSVQITNAHWAYDEQAAALRLWRQRRQANYTTSVSRTRGDRRTRWSRR